VTSSDLWRGAHMRQDWGDERQIDPWAIFGANNLIRRAAWAQVGGYDEALRTNGEDCDFSDRVKRAGYKTIYTPRAETYHLKEDTLQSLQRAFWRWSYFGGKRWTRPRWRAHDEIIIHLKASLRATLQDVRERKLQNLPITAWLTCYMAYRELRYTLTGKV
jgi:GT2 family glycosyltransferase